MATARGVYHQDYIARIRYSNALPPPPLAPKLLDIPNTGLSSGQYTGAAFASRLAREQPLNIEADAELGMPLDLVGLRGVFDGDESVIHFPDHAPPIDPKDRALLRPLNTLGKPMSITSGVSFLRRTEYISSAATVNRTESRGSVLRMGNTPKRKRAVPDVARDDPVNIIRSVIKGFDVAYPRDAYRGTDSEKNMRGAEISQEEKDAWIRPRHPTKPGLTLLDKYPILPDLDAFPETGNYMIIKYMNNPSTNDKYDKRLDVALIRPITQTPEEVEEYDNLVAHALADPSRPKPIAKFRYEAFLPSDVGHVPNIKRKFSTADPEHDSEELYTDVTAETGKRVFKYHRLRAYDTAAQAGNPDDPWNDHIAMALHDPETKSSRRLQKAAFIYPVVQRTSIRSVRPKTINMMMNNMQSQVESEEDRIETVELTVHDPTENAKAKIIDIREKIDPPVSVG